MAEIEENRKFPADLYKKFYRTKSSGGFITLRPWLEAGKLSVDIGEVAPEGGLANNTLVWTPVLPFATYLRAVATNTAGKLYPKEEFIYFGGANVPEIGPTSRVLKFAWYSADNDGAAFIAKTGHFKARESNTGAFIPDMSQAISQNTIKLQRHEIAEMSYVVELATYAFTSHENWLSHINGKERG